MASLRAKASRAALTERCRTRSLRDTPHSWASDSRSALSTSVTRAETGQPYAHQTMVGAATANPDLATWSLEWVAPPVGGPVAIHVAANSGNGDDSPLSDLVYAADVTIPPVRH